MENAPTQRTTMQNIVPWSEEYQRHQRLVRTMAVEIERLNEETKQLHAAILMYREVARRTQAAVFGHPQ